MKYGFFPSSFLAPAKPPDEDAADRLSQDLRGRLAAGPVVFELRIQPYIDEARTPIEDPRVLWEDAVSPWHAPVEFRPLGEINRARAVAYRESVIARGASAEPTGLP